MERKSETFLRYEGMALRVVEMQHVELLVLE